MRVELTPESIDIVATKEGALHAAVSAAAVAAIVTIGGLRTAVGIVAGVAAFTAAFAWLQKHVRLPRFRHRIVIGDPKT